MATKQPKQKYYVVWTGFKPGIYDNWEDCKQQVTGFDGAKYKSFKTRDEAEQAYDQSYETIRDLKGKKDLFTLKTEDKPVLKSLAVDAACKGNPGTLEYQGVFTATGTPIFKRGPYEMGTVNIGEFLAIVLALAWLKKEKLDYPIYSDSRTAIAWVRKKQVNTKLKWTKKNAKLRAALLKAVDWLKENEYKTPILKWKTEIWGEIPADFGRK
jgi:ribonuclease HI